MPSLSDLPVEIHEIILKHHVSIMTGYMFDSKSSNGNTDTDMMEQDTDSASGSDDSGISYQTHTTDSYPSSMIVNEEGPWPPFEMYTKAFFPYNVASTCMLWYNILIKIPQVWTKVVFDVAESPSRFLDIFQWSKGLPIDSILVHSSHHRPNVGGTRLSASSSDPRPWLTSDLVWLEATRVNKIMNAFDNHIGRCDIVMFEVTSTGGLPSPLKFMMTDGDGHNIRILVLRAMVTNDFSFPVPPHPDVVNFDSMLGVFQAVYPPMLKTLDICGAWFMELFRNKYTSHIFRMKPPRHLSNLNIRKFGFGRAVNTILLFISAIAGLKVHNCLSFRDMHTLSPTLDDDMTVHAWPTMPSSLFIIKARVIAFTNISKGFLRGFNAIARIHATEMVAFTNCDIPFISHPYKASSLGLTHIKNAHSVKNALCSWKGNTLFLDDCSFDDDLLTWLLERMVDMRLPACNLTKLVISDCPNFTVSSLIGLLTGRSLGVDSTTVTNINSRMPPYAHLRINTLIVSGNCADLTPMDKVSLGRCAHFMKSVRWDTSPSLSYGLSEEGRVFQMGDV